MRTHKKKIHFSETELSEIKIKKQGEKKIRRQADAGVQAYRAEEVQQRLFQSQSENRLFFLSL